MAWVLDPLQDTTREHYLPPWEQQQQRLLPPSPRPGLRCPNCRDPRPPRQAPPPFWTLAAFGFMALLAVALVLTVLQWATGGTESTVAPRRSGRVLEDDDGSRDDVRVSGCPGCPSKCRATGTVGDEAVVCVPSCAETEFACKSNRCVDGRTRCDGAADCDDMSDETACPCDEDVAFRCGLNTSCLPLSRRCDGIADCWDMADEVDCPRDECPPPAEAGGRMGYLCHGWHCVPPELVCDGREDCEDGGDEGACPRAANKD